MLRYIRFSWIIVLLFIVSCSEREMTLCDCLDQSKNMDEATKEKCLEITKEMKGDEAKMMKELQKCEKEE